MSLFQKATKAQLRARVALDGPSGSGKTWTALTWASILGKRTAVIDTERGSASLYSDRFDFDTLRLAPPYSPDRLIEALRAAEGEHYDTVIIDSLSHFWEGEGGFLDIADAAGARAGGNSWAGWKVATPELRHLVDIIIGLDAHVIVTMRSKTEWAQEEYSDSQGRKKTRPVRVGMAPVMRAGMEYEFTVVADLDLEHRMTISKSRCEILADQVLPPGRADEGATAFRKWLESGEPMASRNDIDSIKTKINQLGEDDRKACKKEFVDTLGNPDMLLASQVDLAWQLIAKHTPDGQPFDPPAEPDPPAGASEPEMVVPDPEPAAKPAKARKTPAQMLHIEAGRVEGLGEDGLDLIILNETNGRTSSANELTAEELTAVRFGIQDVAEGKVSIDRLRATVEAQKAKAS